MCNFLACFIQSDRPICGSSFCLGAMKESMVSPLLQSVQASTISLLLTLAKTPKLVLRSCVSWNVFSPAGCCCVSKDERIYYFGLLSSNFKISTCTALSRDVFLKRKTVFLHLISLLHWARVEFSQFYNSLIEAG